MPFVFNDQIEGKKRVDLRDIVNYCLLILF